MSTTNPLIARFAGEPALIDDAASDRFRACLEAVVAHPNAAEMLSEDAHNEDGFWSDDPTSWKAALRPYVVRDGILQIPVKGVLLHNFPYALGSWATGYDYIWRAFQRGAEDYRAGNIKAIAFISDSPGGMVAGCFDAVDKMHALKQETGVPVRGFAHEAAYSAAYAIVGGVSDHVAVSRTGGVGSIGVVTMHIDVSKAMSERGIQITFIHAGKHKVDGNPYEPLPEDVKERIQVRIDELYAVFVSAVARGRGMEEEAVRATEALTFTATQAVSNGLADSIGSLDDALSAFAGFLDDPSNNNGDEAMADKANTSAVDQAALDTARADGRAEAERENATAVAEARTAERELVFAILDSDEGKKRPAAARALAAEGGRTLEQAQAFLAKLPEEQQPAATKAKEGQSFEEAMEKGNPEVGAEAPGGGSETEAKDDGSDIVALAAKVGIKGFNS